MTAPRIPARHLKAEPGAGDGCLEWDAESHCWRPAPRRHLSDRLLIAFAVFVLLYFLGEFARLVPWQAVL